MKKIIGLLVLALGFTCIQATAQKTETKEKQLTTTGDKVHNVFHPRHKRHHGYKYVHKTPLYKRKVVVKHGKTKTETKTN